MIAQLQNAGFMRQKINLLARLARDLRTNLPELGDLEFSDEGPEELDQSDADELVGSLEALDRDETLYRDAEYWMPHNAYAALLQGSIDTYYRENDVVAVDDNVFGETLTADPLTEASLTRGSFPTFAGFKQAFRFNKKDPRWIAVIKAKDIKRRKGTPAFPDNSATTTKLDARARVLLFGDWASGTPGAIAVAQTMWKQFLQPELGKRELHVIHLGDAYYAGLKKDYKKRFLPHWPVPTGSASQVSSWNLAGNHDMYSGGHAYFDVLKDPRFVAQNNSSYFLLENDDWQIFGLDTSFDPRDFRGNIGELYGEQAAWMARTRDAAPKKKCIVLTHHQPFCAYGPVKEHLDRRLQPIRDAGQINAWFWGHEHLCAVYKARNKVDYPVLLGHGGFPEKPKKKMAGAPAMSFEWTAKAASGNLLFGFAVLDFDGSRIDVKLVDQSGTPQYGFPIK